MLKNRWLILLLFFLSASTLWVTAGAARKIYQYYYLDARTAVKNIKWSVVPINDEKYQLKGIYSFYLNGHEFSGDTLIQSRHFRNAWAADQGALEAKNEAWEAWYNLRDPTYNSLERIFPLKETLYSVVLLVLAIYFIGLAIYASKRVS